MLRLYRLIATMDAKAPVPSLADQEPTWSSASDFARRLAFGVAPHRLQCRFDCVHTTDTSSVSPERLAYNLMRAKNQEVDVILVQYRYCL